MITKKDLIVAVILTFCLSVTMFRALPIGSQEAGEYDPWYDINGDGKIDMMDIGGVCRKFGTSGDSTRAFKYANEWGNFSSPLIPPDEPLTLEWVGYINTSGYRYITMRLQVKSAPVSFKIEWSIVDYEEGTQLGELRSEWHDLPAGHVLDLQWDRMYGNCITIFVDNNSGEVIFVKVQYYMTA